MTQPRRDKHLETVVGCAGKSSFPTFALAKHAAQRTRRNKDAKLNPYHCRICDQYHTGSRAKKKHKPQPVDRKPPMQRHNLSDAVDDLAPTHPPCYLNRLAWVEYLKSAAAAQNQRDEPKVFLIQEGEPVFNHQFPFCVDCTEQNKAAMDRLGRCKPNHLTEMESP